MSHLNPHISERLLGIAQVLHGVFRVSTSLSSATKGAEREAFVKLFLEQCFPASFRFGHGDITDTEDRRSGQCDIVVEFPFAPSIPLPGGGARLYLADSIAAVIEVKSNLQKQWGEALRTAESVRSLRRHISPVITVGAGVGVEIPVFIVGYMGWVELETLEEKVRSSNLSGALDLQHGHFVAKEQFFGGVRASGAVSLWLFIAALQE